MTTLREVPPDKILSTAFSLIRDAKTEILATMDFKEELAQPLPEEYFLLLKQKVFNGIILKRLGFGTKNEYTKFATKKPLASKNYFLIHAKNDDYQRMLMVDRNKMILAKNFKNQRKFFFSDDPKCIKKYLDYFNYYLKIKTL
ncbi:MAG: hypothetical protein V1664_01420 [Candidatus Uhrbacteria bacterium]